MSKFNFKNYLYLIPMVFLVWGCATTPAVPHTFLNSYEPISEEYFEQYEGSDNAIYKITGSGFLRQVGGGIVNCAGNPVNAVPTFPTSAYVQELNSLNWRVRGVTPVDPQYTSDMSRLKKISRSAYCDVDGKFEINGVSPGVYTVSTEISWVIPKVCGSGSFTYRCDSKQGGLRSTEARVIDDPNNLETKIIISQ